VVRSRKSIEEAVEIVEEVWVVVVVLRTSAGSGSRGSRRETGSLSSSGNYNFSATPVPPRA
jgi:hypothetical protein